MSKREYNVGIALSENAGLQVWTDLTFVIEKDGKSVRLTWDEAKTAALALTNATREGMERMLLNEDEP